MPRFNCFRAAPVDVLSTNALDAAPPKPRLLSVSSTTSHISTTSRFSKHLHRNASAVSHLSVTSWTSNESISRLPPCRRDSSDDARVDALMMPVPRDARPSRPLRLSHPKTYSALVADMKASKGTRDWRSFAVFDDDDDIDMNLSAEAHARGKILDTQRKMLHYKVSFDTADVSERSESVECAE